MKRCPKCAREYSGGINAYPNDGEALVHFFPLPTTPFTRTSVLVAEVSNRGVRDRRILKRFTWYFAALGAAFHLFLGVVPVLMAGPKDWGPAVQLFFLDLPLVALLNHPQNAWPYCILGTLMYAAAGSMVGYGIDRLQNRRRLRR